jgi:hypothetical protein
MPWLPAVTRLLVVLVVVAARATLTRFVTLADRLISINIDCGYQWYSPRNVRVSVSGVDPGWTRGRAVGLRDLLSEVQAPWWTGRGSATLRVYWAILPWSLCSTPHLLSQ